MNSTSLALPLSSKVKLSLKAVWQVLKRPKYLIIALFTAWLVMGILLWLFNLNLLLFVWQSNVINLGEKLLFLLRGYASVFTNFESLEAISVAIISILMGVNVALMAFVFNQAAKVQGGKSSVAVIAGIVGSGCAACGTGILGPILGGLGATASITLAKTVGTLANLLAVLLLLYSIYGLGKQAATYLARLKLNA